MYIKNQVLSHDLLKMKPASVLETVKHVKTHFTHKTYSRVYSAACDAFNNKNLLDRINSHLWQQDTVAIQCLVGCAF